MTGKLLNIFFLLSFSTGLISRMIEQFDGLTDGRYKLEYTSNSIEKPSIVMISKGGFTRCCSIGDTLTGRIHQISERYFLFEYENMKRDTFGLQGLLSKSFGDPCYEIKRTVGDTIFFRTTYASNLHLTINEGRFIRLK